MEALRGLKVAAVAAGSYHSLAVADGRAYSFGDGGMGQLGHGDRHEQLAPKRIGILTLTLTLTLTLILALTLAPTLTQP